MRSGLICAVVGVFAVMLCAAQSSAPAPVVKKAPVAKTATPPKPAAAAKQVPAKTGSAAVRKSTKKAPPVHTASRPRQMQPTAERYHEIQSALVAKGYLNPEQATGAWDQNSIDALKKFQAEQKLDASGKITSLSLIALGLGPKHDPAPLPSPAPGGGQ
jgi:hypothetical protein